MFGLVVEHHFSGGMQELQIEKQSAIYKKSYKISMGTVNNSDLCSIQCCLHGEMSPIENNMACSDFLYNDAASIHGMCCCVV